MRMSWRLLLTLFLIPFLQMGVFADLDPTLTAPTPAGRVLVIYNKLGLHNYEFSEGAMGTFHAALTGDLSKLTFDNLATYPINDMPPISPAPQVDTLNITRSDGIYTELMARFGSQIPDSLKGGNELDYWNLVFDIRFSNSDKDNDGPQSISLDNTPTSDLNLYRQFLTRGGGLYLQAEYNLFKNRNEGITSLINLFTQEQFDPTKITGGSDFTLKPTDYSSVPEQFNKDFNDLTDPSLKQPRVAMGGTYPLTDIISGTPLIQYKGGSFLHLWDSKDLKMQNGRLMVGFDINVFGDHDPNSEHHGEITEGTFAFIQNIYDLISGIKYYDITKEFTPNEIDLHQSGKFLISIKNKSNKPLNGFEVVDTVSPCLDVTGASPTWNSGQSGNVYHWTVPTVNANSTYTITVDYTATKMPPCN